MAVGHCRKLTIELGIDWHSFICLTIRENTPDRDEPVWLQRVLVDKERYVSGGEALQRIAEVAKSMGYA